MMDAGSQIGREARDEESKFKKAHAKYNKLFREANHAVQKAMQVGASRALLIDCSTPIIASSTAEFHSSNGSESRHHSSHSADDERAPLPVTEIAPATTAAAAAPPPLPASAAGGTSISRWWKQQEKGLKSSHKKWGQVAKEKMSVFDRDLDSSWY